MPLKLGLHVRLGPCQLLIDFSIYLKEVVFF